MHTGRNRESIGGEKMSKIYVNPGHGGSDSGAVGIGGRQEKADNLRYASAVAGKLEAAGHTVKLERDGDYLLSVKDIASKANRWGADLFIAFHRNSGGGYGAECLIVTGASQTSRSMAQAIQNALVGVGFRDRGVKVQDSNTYVLSHTTMPATTIECGFVDNANDNALFDSKFDAITHGIANAILSIAGGSIPQEEEMKPDEAKVTAFVNRLYTAVLGRQPGIGEAKPHIDALLSRALTPAQIGYNFYFSDEELKNREANEEFIRELYRGLMGREPSAPEVEGWAQHIYKDMSREALLNAFVGAPEFEAVAKDMGF